MVDKHVLLICIAEFSVKTAGNHENNQLMILLAFLLPILYPWVRQYISIKEVRNSAEDKWDNVAAGILDPPALCQGLFFTKMFSLISVCFISNVCLPSEFQIQQLGGIMKKRQAAKESKRSIVVDLWPCSSLRDSELSSIRAVSD